MQYLYVATTYFTYNRSLTEITTVNRNILNVCITIKAEVVLDTSNINACKKV